MKKIQEYSRQSPIVFSVGVMLGVVVVNTVVGLFFRLLPNSPAVHILYELLFIAWPAAVTIALGFGFIYRQKGFFATLGAGLPFFLFSITAAIAMFISAAMKPDLQWKSAVECVLGALMLIGVGFREESLFRGVILNSIARKYGSSSKGLWITLLASGAIFGVLHMGNAFNGVSFPAAVIQSISAAFSGIYFGAIYLRGGSIWAIALMHTIFNCAGTVEVLFANGGTLASVIDGVSLASLITVPGDLLLTAFLLRKSKRQKVLDRLGRLYRENP